MRREDTSGLHKYAGMFPERILCRCGLRPRDSGLSGTPLGMPDEPRAELQRRPLDERLDREELRLRLAVSSRTELLDCRAELVLYEVLEVFLRLPDVVDIPALIGLAGCVEH